MLPRPGTDLAMFGDDEHGYAAINPLTNQRERVVEAYDQSAGDGGWWTYWLESDPNKPADATYRTFPNSTTFWDKFTEVAVPVGLAAIGGAGALGADAAAVGGTSAAATGGEAATLSTLMPAAVPEADATFGGALIESSPGVWTAAPTTTGAGVSIGAASDFAAKAAATYRAVKSALGGGIDTRDPGMSVPNSKQADVSPINSAPWKNPTQASAENATAGNGENSSMIYFIVAAVAAIFLVAIFRR